jgi:ribosomal protein S18 acetylase RimI-like enzyme
MIEEARAAEADSVYLLSDQSDAIRLYQALGFREVGRIASSFRPL